MKTGIMLIIKGFRQILKDEINIILKKINMEVFL